MNTILHLSTAVIVLLLVCFTARAAQTNIVGPSGSGAFGTVVAVLPNGNFVVSDPEFDQAGGNSNVGAVYLYNGQTLAVISTLKGSRFNDSVSNGGVTVLSNGNFVVESPWWDSPAGVPDVGAVTWCSGVTGCEGSVSAANSRVGNSAFDNIGGVLIALANGNFVASSGTWDSPTVQNVGAVTWCNGTAPCTGMVSPTNSLVGDKLDDEVGQFPGPVALTNGNYVVLSRNWDSATAQNVGAVTWGDGAAGTTGVVSAANSLVGSTANDRIGGEVTPLTNGNYVVRSANWQNAGIVDAGAATWGNGNGGTVGPVTAANSLVGIATRQVAGDRVRVLTNGNYVVVSPGWFNPSSGPSGLGAVTWGNGMGGTVGQVTPGNSLVGGSQADVVGTDVVPLTNGNYVVTAPAWANPEGPVFQVGAVTWCSGSGPTTGLVSTGNSLIGDSFGDAVGLGGVIALTNGNYVVSSFFWDAPGIPGQTEYGAVTLGNGSTGTVGIVTEGNSLTGSAANHRVGANLWALSNGGYVVRSWPFNGGAVTWCPATGCSGTVTAGNSLTGTNDSYVGSEVTPLTNGNYVIQSPLWDGGGTNLGALTLGNGSTGTTGSATASNSLVGSTNEDLVGFDVTPLPDGNYVLFTAGWDNPTGPILNAGAITLGNGLGGPVGPINSGNSVVGSMTNDFAPLYPRTFSYDSSRKRLVVGRPRSNTVVLVGVTNNPGLFDYDADGKTDFSVFRPSQGAWYLQKSTEGFFGMLFGFATDKIVPADYDGDGKTDIAVFRPADLRWYIANSSDGSYRTEVFGLADDQPAPADYDGDGKADLCVFRPSDGTWYLQRSSNGSYFAFQFGGPNDKPTVGDFDGDGKSDFAVFRTTNGEWYQHYSSDGSIHGEQFGFTSDRLAYADYDGDGKTDLAIFRPDTRIFYIKYSGDSSYQAFFFGIAEDIPTPGDYDGDGKADLSVFRPSDGNWYRQNSSNGSFNAFQFGLNGDRPTPTAYQ